MSYITHLQQLPRLTPLCDTTRQSTGTPAQPLIPDQEYALPQELVAQAGSQRLGTVPQQPPSALTLHNDLDRQLPSLRIYTMCAGAASTVDSHRAQYLQLPGIRQSSARFAACLSAYRYTVRMR
jgi:hypothetical protein